MDSVNNKELLFLAQRIRALSQCGLTYSQSEYDKERYEELLEISNKIAAEVTGKEVPHIDSLYTLQKEYPTPKVDIRAVVFNEKEEILLVREKADGQWSLPGGWADIGFSPSEIALKEIKEETGLNAEVIRLLAVTDMRRHNHPVIPYYVYKLFILCKITGGEFTETFDILGKGFFPLNELPPLSLERVVPELIEKLYDLSRHPEKGVYID